jgi:hypothetical protein
MFDIVPKNDLARLIVAGRVELSKVAILLTDAERISMVSAPARPRRQWVPGGHRHMPPAGRQNSGPAGIALDGPTLTPPARIPAQRRRSGRLGRKKGGKPASFWSRISRDQDAPQRPGISTRSIGTGWRKQFSFWGSEGGAPPRPRPGVRMAAQGRVRTRAPTREHGRIRGHVTDARMGAPRSGRRHQNGPSWVRTQAAPRQAASDRRQSNMTFQSDAG